MSRNASAIAYFAESIRREASGQHTVVGIYDDISEFSKLPATFPRISILVTLSTLVDDPFRPKTLRVKFVGGETLLSNEIPKELDAHQQEAISGATDDTLWIYLKVIVNLEQVDATDGKQLVVEFEDERGNIARSNSLTFKAHTKPMASFGE